ncbi:MAG: hypothetical protein FWC77_00150 [Defluviitaleaceae bacterium]|nr:hypothetical protein [Defluviitaleaceae bacterium]
MMGSKSIKQFRYRSRLIFADSANASTHNHRKLVLIALETATIKKILIWCVFCILLTLGFLEAGAVNRFHGASLRFSTPINGDAAYRARQYSISNTCQNAFWPTFWHESKATLSAGARSLQTSAISFSGNAAVVWPADFLIGSAPSSVDAKGIAVSRHVALSLWGSTDIVGMTVCVNEKPRIVRGVFEGMAELALVSFHIEDTTQSWTGVELSSRPAQPRSPTRSDAEGFAILSGLGRPDYVLMGGAMALARFMALFPALIPAVYGLALFVGYIKKYYRAALAPLFFAILILIAILLPTLLDALPPWIIPTHWSDFSFWSSLSRQAGDGLREFLAVPPMLRDVELRMGLLKQMGIFVVSVWCSIVVCVFHVKSL